MTPRLVRGARRRRSLFTTSLLLVALSCGGDDSAATGTRPDGGDASVCAKENDDAFCARLGRSCGPLNGRDLCGNDRVAVGCGLCPTAVASSCLFAGDPSGVKDSTLALREAIQCSLDHGYASVALPKGDYKITE